MGALAAMNAGASSVGSGLPDDTPAASPATTLLWPWRKNYTFSQLGRKDDVLLSGVRNTMNYEFQVRRDRLVREAGLDLTFTPSPALIPQLSHVRVYLNDAFMGVVPIDKDRLGQAIQAHVPLDARLIADFNRVRLEFIGHYTDICEEPTHSALWANVASTSQIRLRGEPVAMKDDLAHFPIPFFDPRDAEQLVLPFVLSAGPSLPQQRAAALVASQFGALSGWWRQARFPVSFDLPSGSDHAVVMGVNGHFPAIIADHAPVDGPLIALQSMADAPERKLLLILGRDDKDLLQAAQALAAGQVLLRGSQVQVNGFEALTPRRPYDAPNWVRTDRPVRFSELVDYPNQLHANGLSPDPVMIDLNLPPDLFIWRNQGIPMKLRYRYTPPMSSDESRLRMAINEEFIASFPLPKQSGSQDLDEIRLPVLASDRSGGKNRVLIPALKLGERNKLRFDFNFASVLGSAQRDHCQSMLPPNLSALIEEDSTIDFSNFHHYIGLPDLSAFSLSGFPFTRMADLSETIILMPHKPTAEQLTLLLTTAGGLGAQSGYPAFGLRLSNDWASASTQDADLLLIGEHAGAVPQGDQRVLLMDAQRTALTRAAVESPQAAVARARRGDGDEPITAQVTMTSAAPFAAILGWQSPVHPQRSVVALMGSRAEDIALLDAALSDVGQRQAIAGSVAILRTSGIDSQFVGEHYYVGSLPWWLLLWYDLADHPVWLAMLSTLVVLLFAFLLWRVLRGVARRRLERME